MSWSRLSDWWLGEVANDAAYEAVVTPLLLEVFHPEPGMTYLDLGCGEGRVIRAVEDAGATVFGVEINESLARRSGNRTILARLPTIPARSGSIDGAYAVLILEHVADEQKFFEETARVVRAGGGLCLVMNHPVWTAPNSTPITDTDGEVLWRPGAYFSHGTSEVSSGEATVTFHHRSMGALLNAAADAGWTLESLIERPHHDLEGQSGIPRLLASRWRLRPADGGVVNRSC